MKNPIKHCEDLEKIKSQESSRFTGSENLRDRKKKSKSLSSFYINTSRVGEGGANKSYSLRPSVKGRNTGQKTSY